MEQVLSRLTARWFIGSLFIISMCVLGSAYILENVFGVRPCQMCLYERDVFFITATLTFFSFFLSPRIQNITIAFLGLIFLGGTFLAGYHVAIQQHWVALPGFCNVNDFSAFDSVESLKAQLLQTPLARCDQVTWSLFGLSLAVYNALLSFGLTILCAIWLVRQR